jgi:hypothetical protein
MFSFTDNKIDSQRENFQKNDKQKKLIPEWVANLGE